MHKILILGPQGSGKGTQAKRLAQKLGVPALSMGQLLRDEVATGSALGKEIDTVISKRGELVSDQIAMTVLMTRLHQPDCANGYILDGFPRMESQYDAFAATQTPTAVIVINVPKDVSLSRMQNRAVVEQRADDTPELMEKRLNIYHTLTIPVVERYRAQGVVHEISGLGSVEDVERAIDAAL